MSQHQLYSEKVLEHFRNPKNMGEIKNPDGVATVGNPVCGDVMKLFVKIDKETDRIKEVKFQALGCGAAIATSSMTTELAKGKTVEEAGKMTNQAVIKALGGLPTAKRHCSLLAVQALRQALKEYLGKEKS